MNKQYVACKFRAEDKRTYTYVNEGEPVAPGDKVRISDRSGDGWQAVIVAAIVEEKPPFECKPILGKIEPKQAMLDIDDDSGDDDIIGRERGQ